MKKLKSTMVNITGRAGEKLGIFAGSFDPVHDGHIEVARMALEFLELDKLYFMVEPKPRGDKSPADIKHREKMTDLGLEKIDGAERLEMSHSKFTIKETLADIENKFPVSELFFILGADTFMKMNQETWTDLDKLTEHYLVVFERGLYGEDKITQHARELGQAIAILPSPHPKHSSTDVRFSENKHLWLPKKVAEYIADNKLYN